jgi:hypothetical protein
MPLMLEADDVDRSARALVGVGDGHRRAAMMRIEHWINVAAVNELRSLASAFGTRRAIGRLIHSAADLAR